MSPVLLSWKSGNIACLTINRADEQNRLNDEIIYSMITAIDDLSFNPDCQGILIQANGSVFSAGKDFNNDEDGSQRFEQFSRLLESLYHFPKPVVTLLHADVYGDSISLLACSDVCLSAPDAKIHFSSTERDATNSSVSIPYLVKVMGEKPCLYHLMTGATLNSVEARQMGFVSEITPKEQLMSRASNIIENMTMTPATFKNNKELVHYCGSENFDDETIDISLEMQVER